ncbi:PP2C family protein-serine/threonine phosphatase [Acidiferrimicrobium sp. IK]|uniref:PP2C family protein-serine/threonine phosphatase n=1 Tax=Acidiferrimicrobium sp. IK TaxID=2871700 RepID=UPI0021CB95A6|nr:SpoIIE family protein phosphatase [Acidiferrimicrobium sp. IK]
MSATSRPASGDADSNHALEDFLGALAGDDPERLYDRAPCGYLTTTADGLIAKVNQTFLTLTGYHRGHLVGARRFVDLLTAGGRIYHETHYAPLLQMHGSAREIALDVVCADGSRLPVLVNSVVELDGSGRPSAIRTAVFDATQRREYERELLRERQRAEESEAHAVALARTLQQSFIPPAHPRIPGLELAAGYRPAGSGAEIGGDFYDAFEVSANDWCLVIGDVCGKGVEAAVVTSLARYTVRAAAVRQSLPSGALATLNEVLLHHGSDRFCTVTVLRLRLQDRRWTATVSCGGHPLPLLIRRSEPPVGFGRPGSLVGLVDEPEFSDTTIELRPGDVVVVYTDGVTEARSPEGEFYDDERLVAWLAEHPGSADAVAEGILREVVEFQSGRPRDDIAVVAVAVPG